MYWIIGADQREYGPVTAEELKEWIAQGRADGQTKVRVGESTEWVPLGTLPEFAATFAPSTPGAIPTPTYTPPPFSPAPMAPMPMSERTNGLAVAGLVSGILGLFCCGPIFATLALIFSAVALGQINRDPMQRGRALAIAGIVLAILGYLIFAGLFFWRISGHRFPRRGFF